MEANENLSKAIRVIQDAAVAAGHPYIHELECFDGGGDSVTVPIAFVAGGNGSIDVKPLLDTVRNGEAYARAQRLEQAAGPDHRTGTAQHQTLKSFIEHANRFKAPNSAIWADAVQRRLVSILDYHPAGAESPARWGRHRGIYPCPLSEAWAAWGGLGGRTLDQDDFAALLDARDRDLVGGSLTTGKAPDPAMLITLANNLEVFSTATAKRERDPNTGRVRISYAEEKGVNGAVMPPPAFLILIPVFQDLEPEELEVRLRVTVEDGQAKFHLNIHAAGDVLGENFEALGDEVTRGTGLPVFFGTPE